MPRNSCRYCGKRSPNAQGNSHHEGACYYNKFVKQNNTNVTRGKNVKFYTKNKFVINLDDECGEDSDCETTSSGMFKRRLFGGELKSILCPMDTRSD